MIAWLKDWRIRRLATRIYFAHLDKCGYSDAQRALDTAAHLLGVD